MAKVLTENPVYRAALARSNRPSGYIWTTTECIEPSVVTFSMSSYLPAHVLIDNTKERRQNHAELTTRGYPSMAEARASERGKRGGGGKLSRSETVTVRLDPKLNYL